MKYIQRYCTANSTFFGKQKLKQIKIEKQITIPVGINIPYPLATMTTTPKETINLTFGESAKYHERIQALGTIEESGMTPANLATAKSQYESLGFQCQIYDLTQIPMLADTNPISTSTPNTPSQKLDPAQLLVIKRAITNSAALYEEQLQFPRDKKALMYGRVLNYKAHHKLCFSDFDQAPDYPSGKRTVINFSKTPHLAAIRDSLPKITKLPQLEGLQCNATYYYDTSKTYFPWHGISNRQRWYGISDRRIVVGIQLGATFPLHFRWIQMGLPISQVLTLSLEDGDMYIMSEKATGNDWAYSSLPTLRHAAGDLQWIDK